MLEFEKQISSKKQNNNEPLDVIWHRKWLVFPKISVTPILKKFKTNLWVFTII